MAVKTNTEKIDELSRVVATLTARLDYVKSTTDKVPEIITKFAVIEDRVAELRNRADETARRKWSIVPALVGATVGALVTLISQVSIRRLWP